MPVIEEVMFKKWYMSNHRYDHPVKFVTIALLFCYGSPDSVVTKPLLRTFVLSICYESQTRKNMTSCNFPVMHYGCSGILLTHVSLFKT